MKSLRNASLGFSLLLVAASAAAKSDNSGQFAEKYFPSVAGQIKACLAGENITAAESNLISSVYKVEAMTTLKSEDGAWLRDRLEALQNYWNLQQSQLVDIFCCARYVTGKCDDDADRNHFIEAMQHFKKFSPAQATRFHEQFHAIYDAFGGNAQNTKEKVAVIEAQIADIKNIDNVTESNAIYDFIRNEATDSRSVVQNFALSAAYSSRNMAKVFSAPSIWHKGSVGLTNLMKQMHAKIWGLFRPSKAVEEEFEPQA